MDAHRRQVARVSDRIASKLRELMTSVDLPDTDDNQPMQLEPIQNVDDLTAEFARPSTSVPTVIRAPDRVTEELDRWMNDTRPLLANDQDEFESVLEFWSRMEEAGDFKILPRVARVLFAIPASACQIERDFSVSGQMVTTQPTSLSPKNVDMCIFLNRNQKFVDLEQCAEIAKSDAHLYTPTTMAFSVEMVTDFFDGLGDMVVDTFSTATLGDEDDEDMLF